MGREGRGSEALQELKTGFGVVEGAQHEFACCDETAFVDLELGRTLSVAQLGGVALETVAPVFAQHAPSAFALHLRRRLQAVPP
jgi:hypothetical protein